VPSSSNVGAAEDVDQTFQNVKKDPIPHKELSKFLSRLAGYHNFMAKKAVLLGIMSGLRQHNIVDLQWEDNYDNNFVDFEKKEFYLRYHKNANQTKKPMIIPFSNDVEKLLKSLPRKEGNNFIFHSRGGTKITTKTYRKAFEFAKEAIDARFNIEKLTPNATRHTFATTLLNHAEGINKEDLADLLGHTTTAMVRRAYAKDDTAYRNKLRNKIPNFIDVKEDDLTAS
jgi:integrase